MGLSRLAHYKKHIFHTTELENNLKSDVEQLGIHVNNFDDAFEKLMFELSDDDLQRTLAPYLRALAIHRLEHHDSALCQGFRDVYEATVATLAPDEREDGDYDTLTEFFTGQAKPCIYANDIEARALAEALHVSFAATATTFSCQASDIARTYYIHDDKAPLVHLYNRPGVHFFVEEGCFASSIPDGNCLYNGFSQHLRFFLLIERLQKMPSLDTARVSQVLDIFHQEPLRNLSRLLQEIIDNPLEASNISPGSDDASENTPSSEKTSNALALDNLSVFALQQRIYHDLKDKPSLSAEALIKLAKTSASQSVKEQEQDEHASYKLALELAQKEFLDAIQRKKDKLKISDDPLFQFFAEMEARLTTSPTPATQNQSYLNLTLQVLKPYSPLFWGIAVGVAVGLTVATLGLSLIPSTIIGISAGLATSGFFACKECSNNGVTPTQSPTLQT